MNPEPESKSGDQKKFVYWLNEQDIPRVSEFLTTQGISLNSVGKTPCQVLKADDAQAQIASPDVFNGFCSRQGSWYRQSDRNGQHLLMTATRLPAEYDAFLDAEVTESDFQPERFPDDDEIQELVDSKAYQSGKPSDWELVGFWEAIGMKLFFTFLGFWKLGETMKKYWPRQCASHANFLGHHYTVALDGEDVPCQCLSRCGQIRWCKARCLSRYTAGYPNLSDGKTNDSYTTHLFLPTAPAPKTQTADPTPLHSPPHLNPVHRAQDNLPLHVAPARETPSHHCDPPDSL